MKYLVKITIMLFFISCKGKDVNAIKAQKWVIQAIEKSFSTDNEEEIFTKEYDEYKQDAINVAYETDGSLTEQEFITKWKDRFDTKYAGVGSGFMISGQDWGNIKVTKCELLSKTDNSYTFKILIEDVGEGHEAKYHRDFTVIIQKNSFLISDIKEYD